MGASCPPVISVVNILSYYSSKEDSVKVSLTAFNIIVITIEFTTA